MSLLMRKGKKYYPCIQTLPEFKYPSSPWSLDQAIYKHPELGLCLDTLLHFPEPNCTQAVAPHAAFVPISAAFVWTAQLNASVTKWKAAGWNLMYSQNPYLLLCIIHSSEIIHHREEVTLKRNNKRQTFRGSKQKHQIQICKLFLLPSWRCSNFLPKYRMCYSSLMWKTYKTWSLVWTVSNHSDSRFTSFASICWIAGSIAEFNLLNLLKCRLDWESYKGGFWMRLLLPVSTETRKRKVRGKYLRRKRAKRTFHYLQNIWSKFLLEKKFRDHTGEIFIFFSPALALKRDNLGRDYILLK